MLLYEKVVNGVRHIFGTQGNIPSDDDVQITYKKDDGTSVTLTKQSPLKDDGHGGMNLDGERVVAWMGNVSVIPQGVTPTKVLQSIAWTSAPTKVSYSSGDALELAGGVVTATYDDASTEDVTSQCTFSPANGAILAVTDTKVTATFNEKTADQTITVVAPVMSKSNKKEDKKA